MKCRKRVYYELRTEQGDGEFDWFVIPPDDTEQGYNPKDKRSAIRAARRFGAQVVRVEETPIDYQ